MTRSPSKLVFGMAVLLGVWITVFWLWKPRPSGANGAEGGITFENPQDMARALAATDPVLTRKEAAPVVKPLPVAPLPNPQVNQIKLAPAPSPQDAGAAQAGKRLVAPEFSDYVVQKGDGSFAAISKRFYGTAKHAEAISKANPFVTPDRLVAGKTKLRIPKDPTNIQGKIEDVAGGEPEHHTPTPAGEHEGGTAGVQTHTVEAGETLGAISKRYYGTTTRWKAILDANSDVLDKPERLKAGMTLKIPAKD